VQHNSAAGYGIDGITGQFLLADFWDVIMHRSSC
jgi:hypothetical protein